MDRCLSEAAIWGTGNELRNLFVTILIFFQVSNIPELWKTHSEILSEDMLHLQKKRFQVPDLQLTKKQIESYALMEIEALMQKLGKSLKDIDGMPRPDPSLAREFGNKLLSEEMDYNRAALKILYDRSLSALNHFQKMNMTQLCTPFSMMKENYSSLAAMVAPTAHSRFRIPQDVTVETTCEIKHGTQLSQLLQKTSLIIWDEAPMINKFCFEALERTLRDILSTWYGNSRSKPFGGLTVVCGDDFRQILPVIPQGERAYIIAASLNSSYLWPHFEIYKLKQNMRLHKEGIDEIEAERIKSFDK
ncbi:uncharacterized protein LOC141696377 [Apium graveolens]|uniref:uncharacterized protein LOC141696377 n=1 Tax=Apium graveolens TaxID=4045 RepID=UPI003D78C40F